MERVTPLIQGTDNKLAVWAAGGGTGVGLLEELPLGVVGLCPTPQFADVLQQVQELYWAGKKREAYDMFGRVQAFATIPGATEYMMIARGVFKETNKTRQQPMEPEARPAGGGGGGGGGGPGGRNRKPLTDAQKEFIVDAMNTYLKPVLRA
jgi:hypothetical protein